MPSLGFKARAKPTLRPSQYVAPAANSDAGKAGEARLSEKRSGPTVCMGAPLLFQGPESGVVRSPVQRSPGVCVVQLPGPGPGRALAPLQSQKETYAGARAVLPTSRASATSRTRLAHVQLTGMAKSSASTTAGSGVMPASVVVCTGMLRVALL